VYSDESPLRIDQSPDGRAVLEILPASRSRDTFYANVTLDREVSMGFPFGFAAPASEISVRWDLPDSTLGVFIGGDCYVLFRYGPRRRRRREHYRVGRGLAFTSEEIAWVVSKDHRGGASGT
jgi:hypothetical protein